MSSSQAASGRQVVGAARGERVPLGGLQPVALKARPTGPNKRPALPLMLPAQQPKKAKVRMARWMFPCLHLVIAKPAGETLSLTTSGVGVAGVDAR